MTDRIRIRAFDAAVLVAALASFIAAPSFSQSGSPNDQQPSRTRSAYHPSRFPRRAELRYNVIWGVDALSVKLAESGEMVRFSYRVLDAARAATLNDAKLEPTLVDPLARVSLVIPSLEKVGKLRQTSAPAEGRSYWMAFSNKGRHVKRGDHVTVVIGQFRAEGLIVD